MHILPLLAAQIDFCAVFRGDGARVLVVQIHERLLLRLVVMRLGSETHPVLRSEDADSGWAFGTQRSGRDENVCTSGGDVIDKAGDEEFSGQQRIGL